MKFPHINFFKKNFIRQLAQSHEYTICDLFSGHGIGTLLHMPPMVNHVGKTISQSSSCFIFFFLANSSPDFMVPGMAFTIEPIALMQTPTNYYLWKDNFTLIPIPRMPSAQWEHTILITSDGCEILTKC